MKLVAKKDIEFEMYSGIKGEQQRIIPLDLDVLEPMLWEHVPEIFGKKPKRIKRLFFWTKSIVEKFALSLEKFPNYVSLITSGQYFKYLIEHLKGIIESKKIWLSDYRYLNDSSELEHGFDIFKKVLYKLKRKRAYKCVSGVINHCFKEVLPYVNSPTYVASFSRLGDSLSQWKAYCPGRGYCIGIEVDTLNKMPYSHGNLARCIYKYN